MNINKYNWHLFCSGCSKKRIGMFFAAIIIVLISLTSFSLAASGKLYEYDISKEIRANKKQDVQVKKTEVNLNLEKKNNKKQAIKSNKGNPNLQTDIRNNEKQNIQNNIDNQNLASDVKNNHLQNQKNNAGNSALQNDSKNNQLQEPVSPPYVYDQKAEIERNRRQIPR